MLKKPLPCLLLLSFLMSNSCQKAVTDPTIAHPVDVVQNMQRLKKVIRHVLPFGSGTVESIFPTEYFYDSEGRVDSIFSSTGQKIQYSPIGRVKKVLLYSYSNTDVWAVANYQYNSAGRVESIVTQHFDTGGQPSYQSQQFFEYDGNGFVVKDWLLNAGDKTVITRENGNAVKVQRFYDANGQEHYLSVAAHDDKINPEYAAGLNNIYPGQYSPNNATFTEIVHWDCADYFAGPQYFLLTYNVEGLLLKSEDTWGYAWVEYIYE